MIGKDTLYNIFKTLCYDHTPSNPWSFRKPLRNAALTPTARQKRRDFAEYVLQIDPDKLGNPEWCEQHILYLDPVKHILHSKHRVQRFARPYGSNESIWVSSDGVHDSINHAREAFANQVSTGDTLVQWMIMVYRGRLITAKLPAGWKETEAGIKEFFKDLAGEHLQKFAELTGQSLQEMKTSLRVWTDKGKSFYKVNGHITEGYKQGLAHAGLKDYWEGDGSSLPANIVFIDI